MNGALAGSGRISRQGNEQHKPSPRGIFGKFKAMAENHRNKVLIKAVLNNKQEKVERLIQKGLNINAVDSEVKTALMHASLQGYESIVKFFIDNGADVNAVDKDGKTALNLAESAFASTSPEITIPFDHAHLSLEHMIASYAGEPIDDSPSTTSNPKYDRLESIIAFLKARGAK